MPVCRFHPQFEENKTKKYFILQQIRKIHVITLCVKMVERVNSFSIAQMQSNLGAAVSLDSTGHSVKNVIIYTRYLITFTFCYAYVYFYLFRYTFSIKTYYMYNMFRFNGRFYGCLNIMRQGVNICLHFCLIVICFFVWLAKSCRSFFPFIFSSSLICPHIKLTVLLPCDHLHSSLHSVRAHRLQSAHCAFRMRLLCAHRSFTYRLFR